MRGKENGKIVLNQLGKVDVGLVEKLRLSGERIGKLWSQSVEIVMKELLK